MGRGSSSSGRGRSSGGRGSSSSGRRSSYSSGGSHSHTRYYSSNNFNNKTGYVILSIVFLIFGFAANVVSIMGFVENSKYGKTIGVCTDNTFSLGWYYSTYSYSVDNNLYINTSSEGWEYPESVGKTVTIYYLKSNPNEITEKLGTSLETAIIFNIMSLGLIVGSIVFAVLAENVVKKKKNKYKEIEEMSIKCTYCGTKLKKDSHSCPNCGASIK